MKVRYFMYHDYLIKYENGTYYQYWREDDSWSAPIELGIDKWGRLRDI